MNPQTVPQTADFVIIGGGVMGASTAYHLAKAGAQNIVLLERETFFGQGATGRCAGGVRYQFGTAVNIELSKVSLRMFETFEEETGQTPDYRQVGYLFVLTRESDVALFQQNVDLQHSLGVMTEWLSGDEIRERLPHMNFPDAIGGTIYHKDGLADPHGTVQGYVSAARRLGVQTLTDIEVTDLAVSDGKITAVHTNQGIIQCSNVVNAAGPWAAQIGKMAGVEIPIKPIRRQVMTTTPMDLPDGMPFVIDFAQSLYFHREGEGLLVGMSNPDQAPGFNQTVDMDWEMTMMEAAFERMPMLEEAGRLTAWAGLYEVTPDAHPIFGATPVEGFSIVAGFSGHGFMHGPVAGLLMAEWLLNGEATTVDVSSLDLDRFAEDRLIHEPNVI